MNRSCKSFGCYSRIFALAVLVALTLPEVIPSVASGDAFTDYRLDGTFQLPVGTNAFDILGDGRIVALVGDQVFLETDVASRSFALEGVLSGADIPSFGAAFIRVSPDSSKIAVGNNGGSSFVDFRVGILNLETLDGTWFVANHFVAEWIDNTRIALTAGDFTNGSSVTILDTTSLDPDNPDNPTIIDNIGGASGGVAFDGSGALFTGNGFASIGPSGTGTVMAFDNTSWTAALNGGPVLDFESEGIFIVDVLGASPLGFDLEGNLFVGGGGTAPDSDSIALVRASAVAAALAGMGSADPDDPAQVRRLDPITNNDFNFYSADYNSATGELYVRDFGDDRIHVYREGVAAVPTASEWSVACLSLVMLTTGTLVMQRGKKRVPRGTI